jgi:hypothetical protein
MSIAMSLSVAAPVTNPWRGWLPLMVLPVCVFAAFPNNWPRWGLMWALALAIYTGCKWLTWRRAPACDAPVWKHFAYLLCWPGLGAVAFLGTTKPIAVGRCTLAEWFGAIAKLAMGIAMFFVIARRIPTDYPLVIGWLGMIGVVMTLHFGLFHVLSCMWRSVNVPARPVMNSPLTSTSVSEFWGHRWNTAFRDLTNRFLFRPLTVRYGAAFALGVSFLVSGIIHDLVISVPAGSGYGGPTVYFVIQALAIFVSRTAMGRRLGLESGVIGWLFTAVVLLGPVTLLFHRPFVLEIVLPFMRAAGAI